MSIGQHRVMVLERSEDGLVLVTDGDVSPERVRLLQFFLGKERIELRSILDHPESKQDFADTIQFAKDHPPPDRMIGCGCLGDEE